jgi:hypothetical protein
MQLRVWILVLCFFCIGGLGSLQAHEVYTPQQKDTFVVGGDAWEALSKGSVIILDDNGFIISELEMQKGDDPEEYATALRADIREGEQE